MYTANSGNGLDPYGGFPVNCPNGSKHSIRLGNDQAGTEAEGISYEFTIPANKNEYSLIYHYAVVFQDPNHLEYQQPRMEIEITNVTDNTTIDCSSFTFIPFGSLLPGFFASPTQVDNTAIWCKDWSAVSINLNGNAGKTIRLFFKTADCTFRRHFGYAYIDVNSECSSEFVGAAFCPDDTAVNVTAPYGYQNYTWFNNSFSQVIGTQQMLTLKPPPPTGVKIAVEVVPYNGYGCLDTLYAQLLDTLTVTANAGPDTVSCNYNAVQLGVISKPGLVYQWSPAAGLSGTTIANPLATPNVTTTYVLTTRHDGGGCLDTDTVIVRSSLIDSSLQLIGKETYCSDSGDSTILKVQPTDSIQWFKDNAPINAANQKEYKVIKSGSYYAVLYNKAGCVISTAKKNILIDNPRPGIRYPLQYAVIDLPFDLKARQFGSGVLWSPGIHLDNPASYTPVFNSNEDQLYTIKITTATGCVTVDTQMVKVVEHAEIYVPSAFTPNNDGLNEFLRPTLMGIKELRYFRIYNRWGQLLFETKNILPGWNGKLNGVPQPTGVVVWLAEGIGVDNKIYVRKGTSTLIR
jgi:gliding motility-associated-like protein